MTKNRGIITRKAWTETQHDLAEFEKAVARACIRAAAPHSRLNPFSRGDESAVRYGAFLIDIAAEAKLSITRARRRMNWLESQGRLLRDDSAGGRTRWWLIGLAATQRQPAQAPAAIATRRAVTRHAATTRPPHWADVLGVPRDCCTSKARAAFRTAIEALDEADPEYPNKSRRVRDAIDACCREHEIQIEE